MPQCVSHKSTISKPFIIGKHAFSNTKAFSSPVQINSRQIYGPLSNRFPKSSRFDKSKVRKFVVFVERLKAGLQGIDMPPLGGILEEIGVIDTVSPR
jgi:hypothetical protein